MCFACVQMYVQYIVYASCFSIAFVVETLFNDPSLSLALHVSLRGQAGDYCLHLYVCMHARMHARMCVCFLVFPIYAREVSGLN